ncbi:hypothetical protein, partial [Tardiphaga sp.]|uniref:hypothetical protein n=1 Tax=Tardiphaga sp. TaxID=1926292 RepID=UPI0025DAE501
MNRIVIEKATSKPDRSRTSSLRFAFITMAAVPAASAGVVALTAVLLAPSTPTLAATAVTLFAFNALAMPVFLDRRISSRLTAIADALRAARDGRVERTPSIADSDAIGDIARLANDIVVGQADIGRYAMSLQSAEEFARVSEQTIHRLIGGAQGLDQMLAGLQTTASNVSRSSDRVVASLDAALIVTDQTARDFVATASRVSRSADTIVVSIGKAAGAIAPPRQIEWREAPTSPALDAIQIKLDHIGRSIAGLPAAPDARDLAEAVAAPVLARLAEHLTDTQRAVARLESPIAESRDAIEARLNGLDGRMARQDNARVEPDETPAKVASLTQAVMRLEARLIEQSTRVAPIVATAPALDMSPLVEGIERLEGRLMLLIERAPISSKPVDLRPLLTGLAVIESKLIAIEAAAASPSAASHPDLELVTEFDAARAPLQRLLVASQLAVRDIGQQSDRLHTTIDGFAAPENTVTVPVQLDLSPLVERLDDVVTRLASLETATQESSPTRPAEPNLGLLAEFEASKAPMQRILVGFRLALREISGSAAQFRDTIGQITAQPVTEAATAPVIDLSPIVASIDDLALRFTSMENTTREAIQSQPARPAIDNQMLPLLTLDRSATNTALTGLKLMMREIADNATALRSAAEALPGRIEVIAPAIDLSPIATRLDDLTVRFASMENTTREAMQSQPARPVIDNQMLPMLTLDRSATNTALTGLKLMMREIADNATALRSAAEALPGRIEVIAPAIDLSPIAT